MGVRSYNSGIAESSDPLNNGCSEAGYRRRRVLPPLCIAALYQSDSAKDARAATSRGQVWLVTPAGGDRTPRPVRRSCCNYATSVQFRSSRSFCF